MKYGLLLRQGISIHDQETNLVLRKATKKNLDMFKVDINPTQLIPLVYTVN